LRVLIIDDEPPARRGIALRLQRHPDIEVVGESDDGVEGLRDILRLAPDLIFLDVQMPGMDGFEVLRALPEDRMPYVAFLTAFEEHALRALEVHALDYPQKSPQFVASSRVCPTPYLTTLPTITLRPADFKSYFGPRSTGLHCPALSRITTAELVR
jgi:DNA-binding LytR/AlgR family response regulator